MEPENHIDGQQPVAPDETPVTSPDGAELPENDTTVVTAPSNDALYRGLAQFLTDSTSDGMFPLVAYGLDFARPEEVAVLTTTIADLPSAQELVERITKKTFSPGFFIPIERLDYIAKNNAIMKFRIATITGLDSTNREHRKMVTHLVSYCAASRWLQRGFVLVDIVGFSLFSTPKQLSVRMSLGLAIDQCIQRMRPLAERQLFPLSGFNRISTGDGFFIWNWDSSTDGHVTLFVLMMLLMAQTELMRAMQGNHLRLKAAFAIGEAYTFPSEGPGPIPMDRLGERYTLDAIGPVLNHLNRLMAAASPGQILVSPFAVEGRATRKGHERETLNLSTMLERVRTEILQRELDPTDRIKPRDIVIEENPKTHLRVTDKHGDAHYCHNISGTIPALGKDKRAGYVLQVVGLLPDAAPEVETTFFRSH